MTDYTKSTNFATKDSLPPGSALKIVRGTEIDTEFNAIATAVATKADSSSVTTSLALKADLASPALTGTPTAPTPTAGDNDTSIATTAFVSTAVATAVNNVGYPAFKNRIINGAMMIDQRNAGASVTPTSGQYITDRWTNYLAQPSKVTAQQNQGAVTPPAGYSNYLGYTSSSAYSIGATDSFFLYQAIEANNISDLGFGTANASTVTVSFWVRSSLTGTFGGALSNYAQNRIYPFSFTISSANTWEQKSVTITGDTGGTWVSSGNAGAMYLWFSLGSGSSRVGTAGAWTASNVTGVTGQQNVVGTNGATFYITGVQLEKGSTATSFDYRPYGTELALCQRYYEQYAMYLATTAFPAYYKVTKRTAPTITSSDTNFTLAGVTPDVNTYWSRDTASGGTFSVYITAEL